MEMTSESKGQLNIMVYGAERFGLDLPEEVDDRNYRLVFCPYDTGRRFNEFDGLITFQRLFETFEQQHSYLYSWTDHKWDRDELDKREKEADLLIKNRGFICLEETSR